MRGRAITMSTVRVITAATAVILAVVVLALPAGCANEAGGVGLTEALSAGSSATVMDSDYEEIASRITRITNEAGGTYGVYVYELGSGRSFGINEDMRFTAASTNKVPLLMKLYSEIEHGSITLDTMLTYQHADYEGGTGSLQFEDIGSSWPVSELAFRMINESDNVAKNIFLRHLGYGNVQSFVDSLGVGDISITGNQATPRGMGRLLMMLFQNQVTGPSLTEEMLDMMTDTEFENRIPRFIGDARVAHKIGNWEGSLSDVGIVYLPGRPFIICVYSKGIDSNEEAEATIARISKEVYDFENRILLKQLLEELPLLSVLQSLYTD